MNKVIILLSSFLFVSVLLYSQTYRCAGQFLEAHPNQCDLFVATDNNKDASAILMCRPSLSYYFCIELNELKDTTSNLIITEFLITTNSIGSIIVKSGKITRQHECCMIDSPDKSMLNERWTELLNEFNFELIYGRIDDLPKYIKMVFYFDSGHQRDYPQKDGQLQLSRNEYERRKALLEKYLKKIKLTIPNLVWPHFD